MNRCPTNVLAIKELHKDVDDMLHNVHGHAIVFEDGWGLYYLYGHWIAAEDFQYLSKMAKKGYRLLTQFYGQDAKQDIEKPTIKYCKAIIKFLRNHDIDCTYRNRIKKTHFIELYCRPKDFTKAEELYRVYGVK